MFDLSRPVELVVLSVSEKAARCRPLESERIITLRAGRLWEAIPGQIVTVKPRKQWQYSGHPYLSGEIESTRRDVPALGLVPLRLERRGLWDAEEHHWGEDNEPIEEWAKPIIARGPRPEFEMEQVLPGANPYEEIDPVSEANELKDSGDLHYEVGLRIGELSLGYSFDGLLPWGRINNRPFLRCMHGYGLCLWRLGRFEEAAGIFDRMLWLNPSDNQGARFLIDDVKAGRTWETCCDR